MNLCDFLNPKIFCVSCEQQWCQDCSFEDRFTEVCSKAKDHGGFHHLIFYGVWDV